MRRLIVFNSVSLDGYFTDKKGDVSWTHKNDPEWNAFVSDNARGGGTLLFGRVTYELMLKHWPTPQAAKDNPVVAEQMNKLSKVVFSRTLDKATWNNTKLVKNDIASEVRKMKSDKGPDMVLMGSGTIVSQLTSERLIDEYQMVVNPIVLGEGRTMFDGVKEKLSLKRTNTRAFANGNVILYYETEA